HGIIKIAGYGNAMLVEKGKFAEVASNMLTNLPIRRAPETLTTPAQFSTRSDCWDFGMLSYEVFSNGEKPWKGEREEIERQIRKGDTPRLPSAPFIVTTLINALWTISPAHRPT
ncbi:hypothetical protein PMAYCL1PPCAC_11796, partial [Pristionchus mayeri]